MPKTKFTNLQFTLERGDERGSISPLLIALFSILMILIFIISNAASAYVARRDLTNRVESALASGAQRLDLFAYYYGAPLTRFLAEESIRSGELRVPIDCEAAREVFERNLFLEKIEFERGSVESFRCDGFEISAVVSEVIDLPFQARVFNLKSFKIEVSASTTSLLLGDTDSI